MPSRELRSAYYALAHKGTVHHVFNAAVVEYAEVCKRAAALLTGRHKPTFRNNKAGQGDVVVVCNAGSLRMAGDKLKYEKLRYHTGRPGGLKTRYFRDYAIERPEFLFYYGVYRRLPRTQLRFRHMEQLFVYAGPCADYAPFLPNVS